MSFFPLWDTAFVRQCTHCYTKTRSNWL